MSDERKPLLSDEYMHEMIVHGATNDKPETPYRVIAESVRSFYERLVAEGKLRVVDEVEFVRWRHASSDLDLSTECSGCGFPSMASENGYVPSDGWKLCPDCGNKIKRCTSA